MSDHSFEHISTDDLTTELISVLEYWSELANDRWAPSWDGFDLLSVPTKILPTTMVIDIADPVEDSVFRFWGTRLTDIHGQEMTGRHPREINPPELASVIVADHKQMVEDKKPSARHYSFTTARGFGHSHSLLRLPLTDDGANVTHLVVTVDYSAEALSLIGREGPKFRERVSPTV